MRLVEFMIGPHDFATLKADQFMQNAVPYYHDEDTGDMLARAITAGDFESVPVLASDGKAVGIVTEFDLLKAIREGKQLWRVKAGDIMNKGMISVAQDTPTMEIIQLLLSKHLIPVTVVGAEGKPVGVISGRDILFAYLRATKPIWRF